MEAWAHGKICGITSLTASGEVLQEEMRGGDIHIQFKLNFLGLLHHEGNLGVDMGVAHLCPTLESDSQSLQQSCTGIAFINGGEPDPFTISFVFYFILKAKIILIQEKHKIQIYFIPISSLHLILNPNTILISRNIKYEYISSQLVVMDEVPKMSY